MSDDNKTEAAPAPVGNMRNELINSVLSDLKKGEKESVKAKLKAIMIKRNEAEKTIRLLDLEADKLVEDFNNGVL